MKAILRFASVTTALFVFSAASKHVDRAVVNQTLPEAMLYVWQGYEANK